MPGYTTTTTTTTIATTTTIPEEPTTTTTVEVGEPPVPTTIPERPVTTNPHVSVSNPPIPVDATPIIPEPICTEDMDCWDCVTMGNLVCSTISTDNSSNYSTLPNTGSSPTLLLVAILLIAVGRKMTRV